MKAYNSILLIDDDDITNSLHTHLLQKLNLSDNIVAMKNGFDAILHLKRSFNITFFTLF